MKIKNKPHITEIPLNTCGNKTLHSSWKKSNNTGNNTTNTTLWATEKWNYVAKIKTDKLLKAGDKNFPFFFGLKTLNFVAEADQIQSYEAHRQHGFLPQRCTDHLLNVGPGLEFCWLKGLRRHAITKQKHSFVLLWGKVFGTTQKTPKQLIYDFLVIWTSFVWKQHRRPEPQNQNLLYWKQIKGLQIINRIYLCKY